MAASFSLTLDNLQTDIHASLRAWHTIGGTPENLLESLLLVQERQAIVADDGSPAMLRLATNQVLLEGIDELEAQDQTGARVLRLRFPDNNTILMVANKLNVSEHTVSRLQRAAINRLAEIILGRETAVREARALTMEAHLQPASYTRLFGLDDARARLVAQLLQAETPWVIAIVGIGGIGKTALADAVVRKSIRYFHFDQVIWLRLNPQTMSGQSLSPRLTFESLITDLAQHLWPQSDSASPSQRLIQVRQSLKTRPYLIVIDNLEAETDTAYLLAHLSDLANPSKFLLTTRTRPSEQATVFNYSLNELTPDDAAALLRHHANDIGVTMMNTATKKEVNDIYEVTGGNPLAIKLVVSLLDVLPLPQILADLTHSRPGPIEDLYKHIYWQTWKILSPDARTLLQAMPLVAEPGALPEYLQTISGLSEGRLWPAIQELRSRSLLEVRGTLQERRYGVHRLTETFLRTEIIHWPEDNDER